MTSGPLQQGGEIFGRVPVALVASGALDGLKGAAPVKVLLVLFAHIRRDDWTCWPCLQRIEDLTGLNRRSVQRALRSLEASGIISVEQSGRGQGHKNVYRINPKGGTPTAFHDEQKAALVTHEGRQPGPGKAACVSPKGGAGAARIKNEGTKNKQHQTNKAQPTPGSPLGNAGTVDDDVSFSQRGEEEADQTQTAPLAPAKAGEGVDQSKSAGGPEREAVRQWMARHKIMEPKRTNILDNTPGLTVAMLEEFWREIGETASNPAGVLIVNLERDGAEMVRNYQRTNVRALQPPAIVIDLKAMAQALIDRCQTHLAIGGRGYPKDRLSAGGGGLVVWCPERTVFLDMEQMAKTVPDGAGVPIEPNRADAQARKQAEDAERKRQQDERAARANEAHEAWKKADKTAREEGAKAAEAMKELSESDFRTLALSASDKHPKIFPSDWIEMVIARRSGPSIFLAPIMEVIGCEMSPAYASVWAEADRHKKEWERLKRSGHER